MRARDTEGRDSFREFQANVFTSLACEGEMQPIYRYKIHQTCHGDLEV